jgi:hypothetical protein
MSAFITGNDTTPLNRMLQLLGNTDRPMLSYIWRAWLIAVIGSLALAAMIVVAGIGSGTWDKLLPAPGKSPWGFAFGALIFSPWLETLLMWPILGLIRCFTRKPLWIASVSAVIWGGLHASEIPASGLITWWPFLVFSLCFLEWQKKSTGKAIAVTALVHTCQNALPAISILLLVFLAGTPSSELRTTDPIATNNRPTVKKQEVKPQTGGSMSDGAVQKPTLIETPVGTKPSKPESKRYQWGK